MTHSMQFGWLTLAMSPSPDEDGARIHRIIEQACLAETLGFSDVWLTEHYFTGESVYCDSLMFAAALAFSLDIKLDAIRQGLRTFDTTFFQAPGRMNVYDEHPITVIFDYAHTAHAVGVMADLAGRLDVRGRRIVVVAGPGDRRDEDIRDIALAVAGRFDHYICRRDDGLRGRDGDEVPRIQAKALLAQGARVVISDLGTDRAGEGEDQALVTEALQALKAQGGEVAVARVHRAASDWLAWSSARFTLA